MDKNDYKYERQRASEQKLDEIVDELSFSPRGDNRSRPTKTLKDHIAALLDHAQKIDWKRQLEKEAESNSINWALSALFVLAIIFLFNGAAGSGDWDWLDNHRFAIRLWGIAFAAVFIGVSVERSSLFKSLWAFGFTKLVASLAVSALIIFSTGKASSLINTVFSVDASALPFTRAFVTGLLAFQYSYPLLIVVVLFAIIHGLNAIDWMRLKWTGEGRYESPPLHSMAFLAASIVLLVFCYRWVNSDFSDKAWPAKIYRLAHVLDFNSKYECSNLREGLSVIFLGPDHSRVLIDTSGAKTDDIESFVDERKSNQVNVPTKFYVFPCDATRLNGQG